MRQRVEFPRNMRSKRPLCSGPERFTRLGAGCAARLLLRYARRTMTSGHSSECVSKRCRSFCLRVSGAVAPSALLAQCWRCSLSRRRWAESLGANVRRMQLAGYTGLPEGCRQITLLGKTQFMNLIAAAACQILVLRQFDLESQEVQAHAAFIFIVIWAVKCV